MTQSQKKSVVEKTDDQALEERTLHTSKSVAVASTSSASDQVSVNNNSHKHTTKSTKTVVQNKHSSAKVRVLDSKQKGQSPNCITWEPSDKYRHRLPSDDTSVLHLLNTHPELLTKYPPELFELCCSKDLFEYQWSQTELYAHRDRNCPSFTKTSESSLGLCYYLDIIACHVKETTGVLLLT